jgi:YbgC/YbaW family acyl-CoA thioester hydrolase
MFTYRIKINESELESGYNHVNHAKSLSLLELGRLEFLNAINFSNRSFQEKSLFLVVTEVNARYLREIFAGDITVTVDSAEVFEKDLVLTQRVLNSKNKECITATITFRFLSGITKRSIYVPEDFIEAAKNFIYS